MRFSKYLLGTLVAWIIVTSLDLVANGILLAELWKTVHSQGLIPSSTFSVSQIAFYIILMLLSVSIMGLFYIYGGTILHKMAGKVWLAFGIGTFINLNVWSQGLLADLPGVIMITESLVTWLGYIAGLYVFSIIYGEGIWSQQKHPVKS